MYQQFSYAILSCLAQIYSLIDAEKSIKINQIETETFFDFFCYKTLFKNVNVFLL